MKFYYTDGIIKTDAIPEILDFHNYLLRKSKKVDKLTLALESTQALQRPETIRVSNCKQTYEELRARF